jgi:hypothetical protein
MNTIAPNSPKPEDRPDWPLPSFDARDWAKAFCKTWSGIDEDVMVAWFANALMRGYDQRASEERLFDPGAAKAGEA